MKVIAIALVFSFLGSAVTAPKENPCAEWEKEGDTICDDTEYEVYRKCIDEQKHKIEKRQAICPYAQQNQLQYQAPYVQQPVVIPYQQQPNYQQVIQPIQPAVPCGGAVPCTQSYQEAQPLIVPQQPCNQAVSQVPCNQQIVYQQPAALPCNQFVSQVPCNQQIVYQEAVPLPAPASIDQQDSVFIPPPQPPPQPEFQPQPQPPPQLPLQSEVVRTIVIEGQQPHQLVQETHRASNITTVIKLTNLINNTNIVNVPTNVNSTNINNINVYTNQTTPESGKFGLGTTEKGSCCFNVRPRNCHTTSAGTRRCHHRRRKECGTQCTARIIHTQTRRRCNNGGCHQRMAYVPQPQPACVYVQQWPYVSCGGNYQQQSCHGCYDHYGADENSYVPDQQCQGCYDDGFQYGPLYRRGPVLRQYNKHSPPCHVQGNCEEENEEVCDEHGCYSEEPAYGNVMPYPQYPVYGPQPFQYPSYYPYPPPPPMYMPQYPQPYYKDGDYNEEDFDTVEGSGSKNPNSTADENDWGVEIHKCRVVGDDGSVTIRNCTAELPQFSGRPSGVRQRRHNVNHHVPHKISQDEVDNSYSKQSKFGFIVENDDDDGDNDF